jgi:hypothetical protein
MRSRKPYHQAMPFLQDLGSDVNKVAAKALPLPAHDLRGQSDLRDPLAEIPGQSGDLEPCRVTHNSIGDDSKSVAGVEKLGGGVKGRHLCSLFGIAGSACAAGGEACGRFRRRLRLDPHRPDSGFYSGARISRRYVVLPMGIAVAIKLMPRDVWEDCKNQARAELASELPRNRTAAIVIATVWLARLGLVAWLAWRSLEGN